MACIHKLNKAITFGCTGGQAGVEALYLVNRGDIKSLTRDYTGTVTDIVLDDYPGDANNLFVNGREELSAAEQKFAEYYYGATTKRYHKQYTVSVCHTLPPTIQRIALGIYQDAGTLIDIDSHTARGVSSAVTEVSDQAITGWGLPYGASGAYQYPIGTYGAVIHWAVLVEGPNPPVLPHSIPVDCYRNGVRLVESLRTADVGDRLEQTLSITLYDKADTDTLTKLVNGSFVAFVKMKELGAVYAVGLNNGLEISSADMDSSANGGFTAISLKTPDGCVGEQRVMCSKTAWDKVVTFSI